MSEGKIDDNTEYKVHLDLGEEVQYFDPNPNTQTIIDYSQCILPRILQEAERKRAQTASVAPERSNDEWRKIGNDWGKPGDILIDFIIDRLEAAGGLPDDKRTALQSIQDDMNNRYDFIMGNGGNLGHGGVDESLSGLENLFKYKSQQVVAGTGSIPMCGGPTDFFRFLFDFVVPRKKKLNRLCKKDNIRSILERPPAAGKGGQCWKAYDDQVNDADNDYDNRRWGAPPPDTRRMHCYICEVKLKSKHKSYIDSFFPNRSKERDFQCEHLFPFTEAMLFWILYRDGFTPDESDAYKANLIKIQKREYAPVCRHCNVDLKTSLGILSLNPDWLYADTDMDRRDISCVILNTNNIDRISGIVGENENLPGHDVARYPHLTTTGYRRTRLEAVFDPMVKAVNKSIKNRGIHNANDLSKFLIYKYLFYFDETIMENIEKMFIGGGGSKKLLKEKQDRNNVFSTKIKQLTVLYKKYKSRVLTSQKEITKALKETQRADKELARVNDNPNSRDTQKERANEKAATAAQKKSRAEQLLEEARSAARYFNQRFKLLFSGKFGLTEASTDQEIIVKISDITKSIKNTCARDYTRENPDLLSRVNSLVANTSASGGGKIKLNQKGGTRQWDAAMVCYSAYEEIERSIGSFLTEIENTKPNIIIPDIEIIDKVLNVFTEMTLDYVKQNDTQINNFIEQVLDKTVDKEEGDDDDEEMEESDQDKEEEEKIKLEQFLKQHQDEMDEDEIKVLDEAVGNPAKLLEALEKREDDGVCDPENTLAKYLKEIDDTKNENIDMARENEEGWEMDPEHSNYIFTDKNTKKTIQEIDYLRWNTRSLYMRQPPITTYLSGSTPSRPKLIWARDIWPDALIKPHCLRCTKGINTLGYNITTRTLTKPERKNSRYIFSLEKNGKIMLGDVGDGETVFPAKFCSVCHNVRRLDINTKTEDEIQITLNEYASQFDKNYLRRGILSAIDYQSDNSIPDSHSCFSSKSEIDTYDEDDDGLHKAMNEGREYWICEWCGEANLANDIPRCSLCHYGERPSPEDWVSEDALRGGGRKKKRRKKKTKRRRKKKKKTRRKNKRKKKTKRRRRKRKKTRRRS